MAAIAPADRRRIAILLYSIFIISLCAIIYQLKIGTISSYLLGNSVYQFSLTIGLFMSSLGLGSYLSRFFRKRLVEKFILIEIAIGLVGGFSSLFLLSAFAYTTMYQLAMVLIVLTIGTLVGLEIPLLTRILQEYSPLRIAIAQVLTWDYLGALVGSLLFPLVLLPYLGLMHASPVVGLLNVLITFFILHIFRGVLKKMRSLIVVGLVAVAVLATALVAAGFFRSLVEKRLYQDEVIVSIQTPYQKIVVTRWGKDLRLYLNGNVQFSSADEYRYHEALVHPLLSLAHRRDNILILGGGDGLAVREILKYADVRSITIVDIDPKVVELCRTFPPIRRLNRGSLSNSKVKVINQDAFKYLEKLPASQLYNAVFIDLPDPNNETLGKLYSVEFYRLIRQHLTADGLMAMQSASPFFARKAFWCINATLKSAGLKVRPYHLYVPSLGDWGFNLVARRPFPTPRQVKVPTRYLTDKVLPTLFVIPRDIGPLPVEASTLVKPLIHEYYNTGWTRWSE